MGCQPPDKSRQRPPAQTSLGLFRWTRLLRRLGLSQELSKTSPLPVRFPLSDDLSWITDGDRVIGDISCNHGTGPDKRVLADCYSRVYRAPSSYRRESFDPGLQQRPVTAAPGILVIGESNIGPDENAVLNRYSGRDENKRSDLTPVTNRDAFFDVDVRVDFRVLADSEAVEVYVIEDARAFPYLRFLDNRISRAFPHFAGIPSAEGI